MAYYNDMSACTISPAAMAASRAMDIARSVGHIALKSLAPTQQTDTLTDKTFFDRRLRAAQLPEVDACQINIFTKLRLIESEANATDTQHAEMPSRARLFSHKKGICQVLHTATVQ
ncbi:MAG: hypothetical protein MUD11_16920 [Rhodobacteraceae bacterium]|jgi:hypothetical protein|nr:hypothetical protein [Paracoccaceae bacterium]